MAAEKKIYVCIANKKNTRAVRMGKYFFNNSTVFAFSASDVPASIQAGVNQRLLSPKATKAEFDKWTKSQKEAAEYGQLLKKARKNAKKRRLGLIVGEEVIEAKKAQKKKKAKKKAKPKAKPEVVAEEIVNEEVK